MSAASPPGDTPRCDRCLALCCRLTVVLSADDEIPDRFTTRNAQGVAVMAHDDTGWCAALDHTQMCCSIYAQRPAQCRKFVMGGPYCRALRAEHLERQAERAPVAQRLPASGANDP